ncbi:hypothetical protein [Cohnella kolymensis]|nr:hypothetical protein [Cohnella kolymensis]
MFTVLLISTQTIACEKQQIVTEQIQENITQSLTAPQQIVIHFGDGNTIQLDDKLIIEKIINDLKAMPYKKVSGPDEVGQSFTFEFSSDKQYSSTGYFVINKKYYKVTDQELVSELNKYVVDYGRTFVPQLLPGV